MRNADGFSYIRAKAILRRFKTLSSKNGIMYRPAGKSPVERRFVENNFFAPKTQKYKKNFWKLKINAYLCSGLRN